MKTRHGSHESFLSSFAINTMKKKQRKIAVLSFGKASLEGNVPANTGKKRRNETWGKIFQRREFLKCLRKRAVSGSGAGDWGSE